MRKQSAWLHYFVMLVYEIVVLDNLLLFGIGTSEECLNSGSWYSIRGWPASETDTLNSERVCVNKVA